MLTLGRRRDGERGQVLPMWTLGTIAALTLAFVIANYANSVRWQIRAQNAADSAAQAVVSVQSDQWNLMNSLLYASNVEEFRIRRLLDAMLLTVNRSGGCTMDFPNIANPPSLHGPNYYSTTEGTCNRAYMDLKDNYTRAVNRYTYDVQLLHSVMTYTTQAWFTTGSTNVLANLQTACNPEAATQATIAANSTQAGGDCGFKYTFAPTGRQLRTGLGAVEMDAATVLVPGLGVHSTLANDSENASFFGPVMVDVVTCAKVPPIVPNFGPFHLQTYYAVGRAAATNVQVINEWMQPGHVCDSARSASCFGDWTASVFQPIEDYTTTALIDLTDANYNWYDVNFGGSPNVANPATVKLQEVIAPSQASAPVVTGDEMSAQLGWWSSMPILPFGGAVTTATAC